MQAELLDRGKRSLVTSGAADQAGTSMPRQGYFRIASTRKSLTAVVVLQLVAEGRLGIDDPVEKWLPGRVRGNGNDGRRVTVRHLLQNTSGLHDDLPGYTSPTEYLEQRYDVYTRDQLIDRALQHRPDFAPGTDWSYSNTGYLLLDEIAERVGGKPLQQLVIQRIAGPLGLRRLVWSGTSPSLPEPHPQAYQEFPNHGLVDVTEQVTTDPDAVLATTHEVAVFFRALLGGKLLPAAQLAMMRRTVPVSEDIEHLLPGARYGLGLISRPLSCGGLYWGHDGGDAGFITVTGATEDGKRSVVLTMNTALGGSLEQLASQQQAADRLVDNALCS
ncbi:serine hydrolase [Kineosporia sp. NBRC 101677]|nr:serine hydrolase [Kineosporia sp. NBRC 101677]